MKVFFINCPFDPQYLKIVYAVVFAVIDCGFIARCALEKDDGGEVRVHKILRIIHECRVGIHDISRTEISASSSCRASTCPWNWACSSAQKSTGTPEQSQKVCLVLPGPVPIPEVHLRHRRSGHPRARDQGGNGHQGRQKFPRQPAIGGDHPGTRVIHKRYLAFTADLPALCAGVGVKKAELIFNDYRTLVQEWLKKNPRP